MKPRRTASDPIWDIAWKYLLLVIASALFLLVLDCCTAHAGHRRLAKIQTRAPVHVARAHARAVNGFPLRQALANTTEATAYVAGTAYRVSGLIPTPTGILANILIRPFR